RGRHVPDVRQDLLRLEREGQRIHPRPAGSARLPRREGRRTVTVAPAGSEPVATDPAPALLAVEDLTVGIGELTLLDGVGLTIGAGETLGLIGETGSGKSLTARAILGLLPAAMRVSGSIRWRGQELRTLPAAAR